MQSKEKSYKNIFYVLKITGTRYPLVLVYLVLLSLLAVGIQVAETYLPVTIMHAIEKEWGIQRLIVILLAMILMILLAKLAEVFCGASFQVQRGLCRQYFVLLLNRKIMNCSYKELEDAQMQIKIDQATDLLYTDNDSVGMNAIQNALRDLLLSFLGIATCMALLQKLSFLVVLVVLAISAFNSFISRRDTEYVQENRDAWAKDDRKINYINQRLTERDYAMDIREYQCADLIGKKLIDTIAERFQWFRKVQGNSQRLGFIRIAGNFLYDAIIIGYIVYHTWNGGISATDFVLYIGFTARLSSFIGRFMSAFRRLRIGAVDIQKIRDILESESKEKNCSGLREQIGERLTIRFDHVSFSYAENAPKVIDDLNLTISAGEKIALVGENGAGKSTLMKLLCGLYQPTEGEIYFNDVSMPQYDAQSVGEVISAVFQEFVVLPFSVLENISMQDKKNSDIARVLDCLDYVELGGLKEKLGQMLIKEANENGLELSGGQTQRLLMARALYKNAPLYLLDEPTSALDPLAEANLYAKYNKLMKGRTAIFVSHRLASTQFCDRILFLKDGKIAEQGNHQELLEQKGMYAELYEIQRACYQ